MRKTLLLLLMVSVAAAVHSDITLIELNDGDVARAADLNANFDTVLRAVDEVPRVPVNCDDGQVIRWDDSIGDFGDWACGSEFIGFFRTPSFFRSQNTQVNFVFPIRSPNAVIRDVDGGFASCPTFNGACSFSLSNVADHSNCSATLSENTGQMSVTGADEFGVYVAIANLMEGEPAKISISCETVYDPLG